jgi:hypothetical protein
VEPWEFSLPVSCELCAASSCRSNVDGESLGLASSPDLEPSAGLESLTGLGSPSGFGWSEGLVWPGMSSAGFVSDTGVG